MSNISMSPKGGGVKYSPQRDIAYLLPVITKKVAQLFDSDFWPEIIAFVSRSQSITAEEAWEQLCDAHQAYLSFVKNSAGLPDSDKKTIKDIFEESGWSNIQPAAQIGYLAMFGQVLTGQMFHGLRDITPLGGGSSELVQHIEKTIALGDDARRLMNRISKGTELKVELASLIRTLRDEEVSWDVIDRIIAREKSSESI